MRAIVLALAALAFANAAGAAPNCNPAKAKPCRNTCIALSRACHTQAAPAKTCQNGKLCRNACMPKTVTCHKTASGDYSLSGPYFGTKYVGNTP